ncbi:hypothetical protein QBC40DRAFT_264006 [Triangularia verruculosa]|uniref:Uncharacterized protein n=1 Tax=Triangularia verruculosa TaxID=2587418 RepID=A0AAN6XQ04_9PEZI|nr:hypothetical protein QBC40DRAFT_264006 [Triangularia verruculosa]
MSPSIWSCPICNGDIYDRNDDSPSWRNRFRGLVTNVNTSRITLTGIGVYDDPYSGDFFTPQDPNAVYPNDGSGDKPEDDLFSLHRDLPFEGKRGFAFHRACWSLLEKALSPDPIPLDTVFQIFDSLTKAQAKSQLDWGDGYGVEGHEYFPWEARLSSQTVVPLSSENPLHQYPDDPDADEQARKTRDHITKQVLKLVDMIKSNRREIGQLVSPWDAVPEPDDGR